MHFDWDQEKNQWLEAERGISFEEIISLIDSGHLRVVLSHPKRIDQKIFIIERDGYACNVPFVEQKNGTCFLKTIYPSRASTRKHLGDENEKNSSR
jgi:hypothetical protein